MGNNGFTNVIRLAGGSRNHEDATTEIFAELLRNEPAAQHAFIQLLQSVKVPFEDSSRVWVATQVTKTDDTAQRQARADLVLRTEAPHQMVVVEIKTLSGLSDTGDQSESQPEVYSRVFNAPVVILAPVRFEGVSTDIPQLTWQQVRDVFHRVRDESVWIDRFINTLEDLDLATDMTIHGVLSVMEYRRFHASFKAALDSAWPKVLEEAAPEFTKPGRLQLTEGTHDRTGYSFTVEGHPSAWAFLGMYYGKDVDEDGVAQLYFFLEVPRGSGAQVALDAHGDEIRAKLDELSKTDEVGRWEFRKGGYETIQCKWSLLDAVRKEQPAEEILKFFTGCFRDLRSSKVLQLFLDAAKTP